MPTPNKLSRPKSITDLFKFLNQNHRFNVDVQHGFIAEALSPATVEERAILLMQRVLTSQSQPKLDHICNFFKGLTGKGAHKSFKAFRRYVTKDGKHDLVDGLRRQPGWGPKTAALFVKNLGYIEMEPSLRKRFWKDVNVFEGDQMRLPVDSVITTVFESVAQSGRLPDAPSANFAGINRYLRDHLGYRDHDLLVWDDLWFWGFITQRTTGGARTHGWNEAKYWAVPHALKDGVSRAKIEKSAAQFLSLVL